MALLRTITLIANHPLCRPNLPSAFLRYATWQVGSRLIPGEVVYEWMDDVKFIVSKGETGLVESIYVGLLEFEDMAFFLHCIDPQDLFVDVGANVGTYTLLSCGVKGAAGYAFEPIPKTFFRLSRNIRLNFMENRVHLCNFGVGDKKGSLYFTADENVTNHVLEAKSETLSKKIEIETLDRVLIHENPTALKIDVEGYEVPVLNGAKKTLRKKSLSVALIETNGSGKRYGYQDDRIISIMLSSGFLPYDYDPFKRKLTQLKGANPFRGNTLFIRNVRQIEKKISKAPTVKILGQMI